MRGEGLIHLSERLAKGDVTSVALVQSCLERIEDVSGEGARTFLSVDREKALGVARAMDELRASGHALSPYAGIPISVKDLFDVAGEVTRAGSRALADATPAVADAPVVAFLKRAGFVIVGRTNMTEFAYSGLGINPHFGTPKNPWDRQTGRIPGGSSSGAAISVTDGMAHGALGTDTGGSCRIPAALTGLVGFKPTARRVSTAGVAPLSFSLDSVGSIGKSVACCSILDTLLSGDADIEPVKAAALSGLRLAVPRTVALDGMDRTVSEDFERTLSLLSRAGAHVSELEAPEFARVSSINAKGGFTASESYAWHRPLIEGAGDKYDPRVLSRIRRGADQSATDYIDLLAARRALVADVSERFDAFDAILMPTVPVIAPSIAECESEAQYSRLNLLILRNPTLVNMFDGCSISIPVHREGAPPVGLMISGLNGNDRRIMSIAAAIEMEIGKDAGKTRVRG